MIGTASEIEVCLLKRVYREMLRIRLVEEKIAALYPEKEIRCPVHLCTGQEAVAVGVCTALSARDYVMSAHRSHGHYLAKGGDLKAMLAELYGRKGGCCGGRGGSMHLIDLSAGFLGSVPIVAGTIPIAVGSAYGSVLQGKDSVAVVFFGDGATEEGVFHESINYSLLKNLPVVFVCENNFYSVYSPVDVRRPAGRQIFELAKGHGMYSVRGDGNDVVRVYEMTKFAVEKARAGGGPAFLEFGTYRWREHCGPNYDNDLGYRTESEFEQWRNRCPVRMLRDRLLDEGIATNKELEEVGQEIQEEVENAVRFAKSSGWPAKESLLEHIHAEPGQKIYSKKTAKTDRKLRFCEAVNEALDLKMADDPSVYIMGLGVPDPKGVFGTTLGLQEKYGPQRVMDMPVAENGMTGVALGSALVGMRPVIVHQRLDFALVAMDQIVNQAAKWHYTFSGKAKVPMVVRLVVGRGWGQGPQHSQSLHAWFAHIPGLKVVMPFSPYDAKGLLISSIEDDNPVMVIEHRWLHNTFGEVPEGLYRVPLGRARVVREGVDITLVAASYMVVEALRCCEVLEEVGISPEVIDVRSLRPLDSETIIKSVKKTGHLIVADSGWKMCGFASELVTTVVEQAFGSLKSAPQRVTPADCPTPSSPALSVHCYRGAKELAGLVCKTLQKPLVSSCDRLDAAVRYRDVPDDSFTGPF